MVKLEHNEIIDPAIDTATLPQVFTQFLAIRGFDPSIVRRGAGFVCGRIAKVVHPRHFADTDPAESDPEFAVRILEAEARDIQDLTTLTALLRAFWGGDVHPRNDRTRVLGVYAIYGRAERI
jgi:hypothetical protein